MAYPRPDPTRIRTMFGSIAARYDRANTVLSAGIHHHWRREAVAFSEAKEGDRILDCATGTGDLAIAFNEVTPHVTGADFVPEMIEIARRKAPAIQFDVADVTSLPYGDGSFDVASIAFGIRNVADPVRGIAEMARVVQRGGRVIVLEFGRPPNRAFRKIYDFYRTRFLPFAGGLITGHRDAYEYLDHSAAHFPSGEEFVALMNESAGFASVDYRPLTFGIAYLYRGVRR